jgi:hypothetical protein
MSKCFAIACGRHVDSTLFGCKPHWWMVPPATRSRIWALYRAGKVMTPEYCEAAITAIKAVAAREGRKVKGSEREIRVYERIGNRKNHEPVRSDPRPS